MPSGHEWRPETNDARLATQAWRASVIAALRSDDTTALGYLYRLKVTEVGSEAASKQWLEIVSAWDSSAVTG